MKETIIFHITQKKMVDMFQIILSKDLKKLIQIL